MTEKQSILKKWGITEAELTELIEHNPSLRGILLGYVAEKKFHDQYLSHEQISEITKDDDHDRGRKGDRRIMYKGQELIIEVKSLQTNTVKQLGPDQWTGKTQVDASDRRIIAFKNKSKLNTTLLLRGEFHLLAVNCFAFGEQWRFAFAKNDDLPCSNFSKYTAYQRKNLIASLITVTWPPEPPFSDNPFQLLDELIQGK
jgi:hypothetical protein